MEPKRYRIVPQEPNKRRFVRVRLSDAVQLYSDDNMSQGALSCDISDGGMRLKAGRFFPVSSDLRVSIRLGAEIMLECKGKVMWVNRVPYAEDEQYQIGLAFDPKSLVAQGQDLKNFLNWNLKKA